MSEAQLTDTDTKPLGEAVPEESVVTPEAPTDPEKDKVPKVSDETQRSLARLIFGGFVR